MKYNSNYIRKKFLYTFKTHIIITEMCPRSTRSGLHRTQSLYSSSPALVYTATVMLKPLTVHSAAIWMKLELLSRYYHYYNNYCSKM